MAERGSLTTVRAGWLSAQVGVAAILLMAIAGLAIREISARGIELGVSNESLAPVGVSTGYDRERVLAAEGARLTGLAEAHMGVRHAAIDGADRKFHNFRYAWSGPAGVEPADAKFYNPQSSALGSAVEPADAKFFNPQSGALGSVVDPADAKFYNPQSSALGSTVEPADVKFFNMGAAALDAAVDRADVKFYNLNDAYGGD